MAETYLHHVSAFLHAANFELERVVAVNNEGVAMMLKGSIEADNGVTSSAVWIIVFHGGHFVVCPTAANSRAMDPAAMAEKTRLMAFAPKTADPLTGRSAHYTAALTAVAALIRNGREVYDANDNNQSTVTESWTDHEDELVDAIMKLPELPAPLPIPGVTR